MNRNILKILLSGFIAYIFCQAASLFGYFYGLVFLILISIGIFFILKGPQQALVYYEAVLLFAPQNFIIYMLKTKMYLCRVFFGFVILPLYIREAFKAKRLFPKTSLNFYIFLFLLVQLLSIVVNLKFLNAGSVASCANRFLSTFFETTVIFFYVVFVVRRSEDFDRVLKFLTIGIGFVCLYGIVEFITRRNILYELVGRFLFHSSGVYGIDLREGLGRIKATTRHPLEFGCVINLILPFQYYYYRYAKGRNKKIFYLALILLSTAAIILTISRSSYVVLLVETMLLLFFLSGLSVKILAPFFLFSCVLAGLSFGNFASKISFLFSHRWLTYDPSVAGRANDYPVILGMVKESFWLGKGLGFISNKKFFVDNYFLKILGETGILGLLSFIVLFLKLIFYPLINFIRYRNTHLPEKDLYFAFFVSILGFLALTFTFDSFTFIVAVNVFWIFVGLMVVKREVIGGARG